jgi:hypothetical protein
MKKIEMTQHEINRKYKGVYIEFSTYYDYSIKQFLYTVIKKYKTIRENTTLGEDVGTAYEYTR